MGVDVYDPSIGKKLSDSQVVAEKAVQNIEANKDTLKKYLESPLESERNLGLSALNKILNNVMMNSSHRTY